MSATSAQAHTRAELDEWVTSWMAEADESLNPSLIAEFQDMEDRHFYYFHPTPTRTYQTWDVNAGVEQWRSLVAVYFQSEDVDRALCLMWYESRGDPNAYNSSGASGLMQVLSGWADDFGVTKADLFDPATNLWIASELRKIGWNQWSPYRRGLCH